MSLSQVAIAPDHKETVHQHKVGPSKYRILEVDGLYYPQKFNSKLGIWYCFSNRCLEITEALSLVYDLQDRDAKAHYSPAIRIIGA